MILEIIGFIIILIEIIIICEIYFDNTLYSILTAILMILIYLFAVNIIRAILLILLSLLLARLLNEDTYEENENSNDIFQVPHIKNNDERE